MAGRAQYNPLLRKTALGDVCTPTAVITPEGESSDAIRSAGRDNFYLRDRESRWQSRDQGKRGVL